MRHFTPTLRLPKIYSCYYFIAVLILILSAFVLFPVNSHAQEVSPSPTEAEIEELNEQTNDDEDREGVTEDEFNESTRSGDLREDDDEEYGEANGVEIISVRSTRYQVNVAEVFEIRVIADGETEDISANLRIDGEEYFAKGGGGACRTDGDTFLGWETLENGDQEARVFCTIPRGTPLDAQVELIAFQFRGCDGPEQPDETVRCQVTEASRLIKVAGEEENDDSEDEDDSETKDDETTDDSETVVSRILESLFGGESDDAASTNTDDPTYDDIIEGEDPDRNEGTEDEETDLSEESSSSRPSQSGKRLTQCYIEKFSEFEQKVGRGGIGGAQRQAYSERMPYIYTELKKTKVSIPQAAYIMGTAHHESGGLVYMKEQGSDSYLSQYNGRSDLMNCVPGDGPRYPGGSFVQLTGRINYTKYTQKQKRLNDTVGLNSGCGSNLRSRYQTIVDHSTTLYDKPNLLVNPELLHSNIPVGAQILVNGMMQGTFTGAALPKYVTANVKNYRGARAVVNGTDRDDLIAGYAGSAELALKACKF
ncbi:MAG: hypothetical protein ACOCXQ_00065 [Patescibacteria group bacterium]